jgi:hypothetical protein
MQDGWLCCLMLTAPQDLDPTDVVMWLVDALILFLS